MNENVTQVIELHLLDGSATGLVNATVGGRPEDFIIGYRSQLRTGRDLTKLMFPGIYMLFTDPLTTAGSGGMALYVGQADNVFERLRRHQSNEEVEDLQRFLAVTSERKPLQSQNIRTHLEASLIAKAREARQAEVRNKQQGDINGLGTGDLAMSYQLQHSIELVLPFLGLNFLIVRPEPKIGDVVENVSTNSSSPRFYFSQREQETKREARAEAQILADVFTVYAGSVATKRNTESQLKRADTLIRNGSLTDEGDHYVFATATPFDSPSTAATFIAGVAVNGRIKWKTESGQTYAQWWDSVQLK